MSAEQPRDDGDVVARLRAADPAAGAEPDLTALRAAVDRRFTAGGGTALDGLATAGTGEDGVPGDELAAARRRRRPTWFGKAAAAAAAVAVVGAGGYAYTLTSSTAESISLKAADPIDLDGDVEVWSDGLRSATGGRDVGELPREDEGRPMADAGVLGGASPSWGGFGGRAVFTASGLPTTGGTARAYGLDAQAVVSRATAQRLAEDLGVRGEVVDEGWAWVVGVTDGSHPSLSLEVGGTGAFSLWDPRNDPYACDGDAATSDDPSSADPSDACRTGPTSAPSGTAPSGAAAEARLREAMRSAGADPADYEFEAQQGEPAGEWTYVTAHHVVGDQRSGLTWTASFSGAGLTGLTGFVAPVVPLGEYDVVSPVEAVERLGDPRFGPRWTGPVASDARDAAEGGAAGLPAPDAPSVGVPPDGVPSLPEAGEPFPWPVQQVTIVEARLGVALHHTASGAAVLLPAYELTSDDGATWSVVAVADADLDLRAEP